MFVIIYLLLYFFSALFLQNQKHPQSKNKKSHMSN